MHRYLLAAGLAAALLPSAGFAQQSCEQRSADRTAGTLVGAGLGALIGGAVAGRDDRTAGVVIGGVGGAVAGNQLAGGRRGDCGRAYGYYDDSNQWHVNGVQASNASGYFDRHGQWMDGAPAGYATNGRWVPVSAAGYYDTDGSWVAGAASGHYETDGRWNATPSVGRYDADGRWRQGEAAGHRDGSGVWVADAQQGYYDNGHWRRGEAHGYYDNRGGWVATAPFIALRVGDGANAYPGSGYAAADRNVRGTDFGSRRAILEAGIRRGMNDGTLARGDGWQALRQLAALGRQERALRHYNGLLARGDAYRMQARLDEVASHLRWSGPDETRRF